MSYTQFNYEPSCEIMHDLRDQLSIVGQSILSASKMFKICGVGEMIPEDKIDTYQSIVDSMDDILLNQCKAFAEWMIDNELVDLPKNNLKLNIKCDHEWSEDDSSNHQCTQCNRRIKSLPCNYCGHDDAIRCNNDYQCTKCKSNKGSLGQPLEFRAYQDAQNAIRKGTADPNDPIIKYTQNAIDRQIAYGNKENQKLIDEQNAALLEHINKNNHIHHHIDHDKKCITIDAGYTINYIISNEIKDPRELIIISKHDLANIKIMVANNELEKDRCIREKDVYRFDLTGELGKQSVVISITNPNPNSIDIYWILLADDQCDTDQYNTNQCDSDSDADTCLSEDDN